MNEVILNDSFPLVLTTQDSMGAATDTTGAPTVVVRRNGSTVSPTVTQSNPAVGVRNINIAIASAQSWVAGDYGQGYVEYTLSAVTQRKGFSFIVRDAIATSVQAALTSQGYTTTRAGYLTGDAYARLGTNGAGLTALGDTRLANLDAAISTRSTYAGGAVASVTAPVTVGTINANVVNASALATDAVTEIQTGLSTFNASSDTVDTNPNATETAILAAVSAQSGTGAYVVTVTVNDGTDPLQSATVRLTEGIDSFTDDTDVSGVATFSLNNNEYDISITKPGYQFTPDTITVEGAGNHTVSMTQTALPSPTSPDMSALYLYTMNFIGEANSGVSVKAKIADPLPLDVGDAYISDITETYFSDENGRVLFDSYPGKRYSIFSQVLGVNRIVTAPDVGTSANIQSLEDS